MVNPTLLCNLGLLLDQENKWSCILLLDYTHKMITFYKTRCLKNSQEETEQHTTAHPYFVIYNSE